LTRRGPEYQLLKFSAVGLLNTGLHYAVFLVLLRLGHLNYLVASALGYCTGLVNSYLLNRRWTFESRDPKRHLEFGRFVAVNMAALGLNSTVLYGCVSQLGLRPEVGQGIALVISLGVNFLGNRLWTFKRPAVIS